MVNGLCASTLSALVPQSIGSTSSYSLRGSQNHRIPTCRTELYKRSFLPTVIEERNKLPIEIRNQNSISCFKNYLNRNKPTPNRLYFIAERKFLVIHDRIRNKCSSLNHDLFRKIIADSPLCACSEIETREDFFLNCTNHVNIRNILFNSLSDIGNIDIDTLLFGKDDLTNQENEKKKKIFEVHRYIMNSKRFQV